MTGGDAHLGRTTISTAAEPSPRHVPRLTIEPAWLFLIAGLALLASTILIPAAVELDEARLQRDRMYALERHARERVRRHWAYLQAVERQEPAVVLALAASQLNQIPRDRTLLMPVPDMLTVPGRAAVLATLEPPGPTLPEPPASRSMLERLTTSEAVRPWLLVVAAVLVLMGVLPPART